MKDKLRELCEYWLNIEEPTKIEIQTNGDEYKITYPFTEEDKNTYRLI